MVWESGCAGDRSMSLAAGVCASSGSGACASSVALWLGTHSSGPMSTVYARVRDEELVKVRHRVTMHTLLLSAAAVPAARLPSRILKLSLTVVRAQVAVRASEMGVLLPVHDNSVEERLANGVSEMVLAMSRMCDSPL